MNVELISYSQPPKYSEYTYGETNKEVLEMVAYCARVSNPSNQNNKETSEKLVRYLIRHKHWSPLEMVSMNLEIDTTRDIARQILRHRSFSFQEFSQRYANPSALGDMFVLREARFQDQKNRQNSVELDMNDPTHRSLASEWLDRQQKVIDVVFEQYNWAIDHGIAKEQARAVFPEGLTKSRMYMNGTLRSWVHFIELRSGNGTQKEHMEVARACAQVISRVFPMVNEFVTEE